MSGCGGFCMCGDRAGGGSEKDLARYECGVCWSVYDPVMGDPVWQVPMGTAFSALPAHWTCPTCAAEKSKFLELADD